MERHYLVTLEGPHGLTQAQRMKAELRFITELERRVGGPSGVDSIYWNHVALLEDMEDHGDFDAFTPEDDEEATQTAEHAAAAMPVPLSEYTNAVNAASALAWGSSVLPEGVRFVLTMPPPDSQWEHLLAQADFFEAPSAEGPRP